MVSWNDVELASIIFHELTHQLLYVRNDASFNEALATTVEEEGVRRWLDSQGREKDLSEHLLQQKRYLEVIALMSATRDKLRELYAAGLPPPLMRERKREAFEALRESYGALRHAMGRSRAVRRLVCAGHQQRPSGVHCDLLCLRTGL